MLFPVPFMVLFWCCFCVFLSIGIGRMLERCIAIVSRCLFACAIVNTFEHIFTLNTSGPGFRSGAPVIEARAALLKKAQDRARVSEVAVL